MRYLRHAFPRRFDLHMAERKPALKRAGPRQPLNTIFISYGAGWAYWLYPLTAISCCIPCSIALLIYYISIKPITQLKVSTMETLKLIELEKLQYDYATPDR
jgi:hypothetical protein